MTDAEEFDRLISSSIATLSELLDAPDPDVRFKAATYLIELDRRKRGLNQEPGKPTVNLIELERRKRGLP